MKKNRMHKKLWDLLKRKRFVKWEEAFEEFKATGLPADEVTYTLLLHGFVLSSRHQLDEAWGVLEEMRKAGVHPSLVRLNERLLLSYCELQGLGATPEHENWRRVLRVCWLVAALLKRRREKFVIKRSTKELSMSPQSSACGPASGDSSHVHTLGSLWKFAPTLADPLLSPAAQALSLRCAVGQDLNGMSPTALARLDRHPRIDMKAPPFPETSKALVLQSVSSATNDEDERVAHSFLAGNDEADYGALSPYVASTVPSSLVPRRSGWSSSTCEESANDDRRSYFAGVSDFRRVALSSYGVPLDKSFGLQMDNGDDAMAPIDFHYSHKTCTTGRKLTDAKRRRALAAVQTNNSNDSQPTNTTTASNIQSHNTNLKKTRPVKNNKNYVPSLVNAGRGSRPLGGTFLSGTVPPGQRGNSGL
eukprot:GHVT01047600.1.p1 GENE.GHVT01047600.1~~GHVT01047600.1.p1  ORF type:complete len:419 (-),score=54.26 GHVT01047600.1:82-1338(-)